MKLRLMILLAAFQVTSCKSTGSKSSSTTAKTDEAPKGVNVIPDTGWYSNGDGCDFALSHITLNKAGSLSGLTLTTSSNNCEGGGAVETIYIRCMKGVCDLGDDSINKQMGFFGLRVFVTAKNQITKETMTIGENSGPGIDRVSLPLGYANYSWVRALTDEKTSRSEGVNIQPKEGWYSSDKGCDRSISRTQFDSKKKLAGFTVTTISPCNGRMSSQATYIRCINGVCDQGDSGGRSAVGVGIPLAISAEDAFSLKYTTVGNSTGPGVDGVNFQTESHDYKWKRPLK